MYTTPYEEFSRWLDTAAPNSKKIYHIGFSTCDSTFSYKVCMLVYKKSIEGQCYLVQRRIGPSKFEFIAVRASKPPVISLLPFSATKVSELRPRKRNYEKFLERERAYA